jgi:hypothetical protein
MGANPQAFPIGGKTDQRTPDAGRKYEGIAFTFCKASTLAVLALLIAGPRFILPLIAVATSVWYGVALYHGQKTTRCLLRIPWVIMAFWLLIGLYYGWRAWQGQETFSLLRLLSGGTH